MGSVDFRKVVESMPTSPANLVDFVWCGIFSFSFPGSSFEISFSGAEPLQTRTPEVKQSRLAPVRACALAAQRPRDQEPQTGGVNDNNNNNLQQPAKPQQPYVVCSH